MRVSMLPGGGRQTSRKQLSASSLLALTVLLAFAAVPTVATRPLFQADQETVAAHVRSRAGMSMVELSHKASGGARGAEYGTGTGLPHRSEGTDDSRCKSALSLSKELLNEQRRWDLVLHITVMGLSLAVLVAFSCWLGGKTRPRPPSYWANRSSNCFTDDFKEEVDVTEELRDTVQKLMDMTTKKDAMGVGRDGRWATHKGFKVLKVTRVENGELWTKYAQTKSLFKPVEWMLEKATDLMHLKARQALDQIEEAHAARNKDEDVASFIDSLDLDSSINERLLFHGSPTAGARGGEGEVLFESEECSPVYAIKTAGFDPRLGSVKGMYGSGLYYADMASKADQYAGKYNPPDSPDGSVGEVAKMFLVRCILGCPYLTDQSLEQLRRPPCIEGHFDLNLCFSHEKMKGKSWQNKGLPFQLCSHTRFHSVMGGLTIDGSEKLYREFVVYEAQAYPEFCVTYERLAS